MRSGPRVLIPPDERRALAGWAAACAALSLGLFEVQESADRRPREAIDGARGFSAGELHRRGIRALAADAHAAARATLDPAARATARAAGHAAAVGFAATHVYGAPAYSAWAVALAYPASPTAAEHVLARAEHVASGEVRRALRCVPRRTFVPGQLAVLVAD